MWSLLLGGPRVLGRLVLIATSIGWVLILAICGPMRLCVLVGQVGVVRKSDKDAAYELNIDDLGAVVEGELIEVRNIVYFEVEGEAQFESQLVVQVFKGYALEMGDDQVNVG